MKYNPAIHNRRSIRKKGYDYSKAGLYFITICVQNKELLFGTIENGKMILNDAGRMIQIEWEKLSQRFNNIDLHEFTVMPNHFHGILEIVGAPLVGAQIDNDRNDGERNDHDITDACNPTVGAPLVGAQFGRDGNEDKITDQNNGFDQSQDNQSQRGAPIDNRAPTRGAPTGYSVGEMIGVFKSITTVEYINGVNDSGWLPFDGKLWQRNFYEHIIRNEEAYEKIADYILNNPSRWREDKFYRG